MSGIHWLRTISLTILTVLAVMALGTFAEAERNRLIIRNDDFSFRLDLEIGRFGSGKLYFDDPVDLAVNEDNDLYILDSGNNRVQVMSEKGRFMDSWNVFSGGNNDPDDLVALTLDYDEKAIFILDKEAAKIASFSLEGVPGIAFGENGKRAGQMTEPVEVTLDSFNYIYIVDKGRQRVLKFHSSGNFIKEWGQEGRKEHRLEEPVAIAYSDELRGFIYVLDRSRKAVFKYMRDGDLKEVIPIVPDVLADADLVAMEIYDDNLFVLDAKQLKLIMLNRHEIHVLKLNDGSISLEDPRGLVFDTNGFVYVSDARRNRIFRFAMD